MRKARIPAPYHPDGGPLWTISNTPSDVSCKTKESILASKGVSIGYSLFEHSMAGLGSVGYMYISIRYTTLMNHQEPMFSLYWSSEEHAQVSLWGDEWLTRRIRHCHWAHRLVKACMHRHTCPCMLESKFISLRITVPI